LVQGWTLARVASTLGRRDSEACFICSWASTRQKEPERVMSVKDCWSGVVTARNHGWIHPDVPQDFLQTGVVCERSVQLSMKYDVAWLIPGLILVGADPMTTVIDPNPATCSKLTPGWNDPASKEEDTESDASGDTMIPSCDTVNKEYRECDLDDPKFGLPNMTPIEYQVKDPMPRHSSTPSRSTDCGMPGDYLSLFKQLGVGLMVRANFPSEPGMLVRSYDQEAFTVNGILQADIRIKDVDGGLPKPADVERLLEICDAAVGNGGDGQSNAVYIHCKGGFGRSVVLAACVAIDRFDVPGAMVLPWCRIARPGAITTRTQELFLKSLKGRSDIRGFARMEVREAFACQRHCGLTTEMPAWVQAMKPGGFHAPRCLFVARAFGLSAPAPKAACALHAQQPQAAKGRVVFDTESTGLPDEEPSLSDVDQDVYKV